MEKLIMTNPDEWRTFEPTPLTLIQLKIGVKFKANGKVYRKMMTEFGHDHQCNDLVNRKLVPLSNNLEVEVLDEKA